LRVVAGQGVSHLLCVPSLYAQLLRHGDVGALSSLQAAIVAGEACPPSLVQLHAQMLPRTRLYNEYGPTEAAVWCTLHLCQPQPGARTVPIGRPIANAQLYVLDGGLRPVPWGASGELFVGGEGIARGYHDRPALTAERFIPDPFHRDRGRRLYRTGDLARLLPDGAIEFLGRIDNQVKIRGVRIELGEVESALTALAGVEDVVVALNQREGQDARLVAYLVLAPGERPTASELRQQLKERLPEQMIPSVFAVVDELPLTAAGKIDRRALPDPDRHALRAGALFVAPSTAAQAALCSLWADVLEKEQVGIRSTFFELGGDSIRVIQLALEGKKRSLYFAPIDVFNHQTIEQLASFLDAQGEVPAAGPGGEGRSRAAHPEGPSLASSMQATMLRHYREDAARVGVYHTQQVFHLHDPAFSVEAFRSAFEHLVHRHPALRTTFAEREGVVHQIALQAPALACPVEDFRGLGEADQLARVEAALREDREEPFDTTRADALLLRLRLFLRPGGKVSLLLSNHHAILDGWGSVVLLKEMGALYASLRAGGALPERVVALDVHRELVALERAALASPETAAFWSRALQSQRAPRVGPLFGNKRPAERARLVQAMGAKVGSRLMEVARQDGVSERALFLSAFLQASQQIFGSEESTVGVVTSGRSEQLSDPLGSIGLFWNILPFHLGPGPSPLTRMGEVQEALTRMVPHAHYPLAQMIADQGGAAPFFACFNFIHFHHARGFSQSSGLQVLGVEGYDRFHYPLQCTVALDADSLAVRIATEFDPTLLEAQQIDGLHERLAAALQQLARQHRPAPQHRADAREVAQ
jgi:hypothetical protein